MNILVTGGTGFIGSSLCRRLLGEGYRPSVLTRDRERVRQHLDEKIAALESLDEIQTEQAPEVIVNLAGRSLGSGRWTDALKQTFVDSRVGTTQKVLAYIADAPVKPRLLVSGSAVGYYGARGDEDLDEYSGPRHEFQSDLCASWEAEAVKAEDFGVRVCLLRTGVVLGKDGGALSSLVPPFRLGLGGHLGDGRQWMSWIHMDDVIGMILFLIANEELRGPFNCTAPNPETNRDFAKKLGRALHRPVFTYVPGWLVRIKVGEMAHLFLTGQKVLPRRMLASGYDFQYPNLESALAEVIS